MPVGMKFGAVKCSILCNVAVMAEMAKLWSTEVVHLWRCTSIFYTFARQQYTDEMIKLCAKWKLLINNMQPSISIMWLTPIVMGKTTAIEQEELFVGLRVPIIGLYT